MTFTGAAQNAAYIGAGAVEFVFASPAQGFAVDVERDGADDVRVTFERDDHESRVDADIDDGEPRIRVREEADD